MVLGLNAESWAQSPDDFSSAAYARVLEQFVDDHGMVDYAALKNNPQDLIAYNRQLAGLSEGAFREWPENDQIALWINAYNAFTLQLIVDHYPIRRRLTRAIFPIGIRHIPGNWDGITFKIMGQKRTLNEIEHEILRQDFTYPAIHLSLVCAARGCPPLRREPYTGKHLDEQHADQTRIFLRHPEKFAINQDEGVVYLSSIFEWFGEDFTRVQAREPAVAWGNETEQAVMSFLAPHLSGPDRETLREQTYRIRYLSYDWSLNQP
jgi:hypothetical protein